MEHIRSLENVNISEEQKAKIINEINESFETILNVEASNILEILNIFINYLKNGDYQFYSESTIQKARKAVLEMIHRLPLSETIRPHVNSILSLMLILIREENEENVLICLRIIIDLHKQYRPPYYPQIKDFLLYIQNIYCSLPNNMDKIFDPHFSRLDMNNFDIDEIYTVTERIIPRGRNSFKVLQELPIVLVLLYQLYKQNIHDHVTVFLPAILNTITLEPRKEFRMMENFNKELFVDFMGAQIKTLAFLAYTIKTFAGSLMEIIESHAKILVQGMILLLQLCPKEVAHLRKELLVATRHILATNLRAHFIPSIELLFDENLLLGRGYTTHESLRPLAYSTLGDFIHHVRLELSLDILSKAIDLFSKNIHDETLPTAIQIMSIRLLLNLVECIRNQRNDATTSNLNSTRKEILQNMLKVFILKFHTIAKIQMPVINQKWKQFLSNKQNPVLNNTESTTPSKDFSSVEIIPEAVAKLTTIGFTPPLSINISEYRLLVKSLVTGIKTIILGIHYIDNGPQMQQQQIPIVLRNHEILDFINFFNWTIEAFYIYRINVLPNGNQKVMVSPTVQREEKELLEQFSGIFLNISSQNFQEIFTSTIEFLTEKMIENQNLQIIVNTFLSYRVVSPLFASVMLEYLLDRMDIIGSADTEKSNLYLKLFKLIFGSVSMFAVENEPMIRPFLQKIVTNSMEMSKIAEEPYNYFLLLRALFRSIGGGTYDILYQEFLPLLPNLLGGLNRLQSGCHKQQMKDLFVELCLTVPVRLSSLLPFLPMLMDPLVSALNGSSMLVTQGLRTLELCVDNLLPDFFCDHIQPVRAELMQSLWKTLRNSDNSAIGAFRILGKFGGGNRNVMIEAQKIEFLDRKLEGKSLQVSLSSKNIQLPIHQIVNSAQQILLNSSESVNIIDSWNIIKLYVTNIFDPSTDNYVYYTFLTDLKMKSNTIILQNKEININYDNYQTEIMALSAMFLSIRKKELRKEALSMATFVAKQFALAAIDYDFNPYQPHFILKDNMHPFLIFDAIVTVFEYEDKESLSLGNAIISLIIKLTSCIMGSRERACTLSMFHYMFDRIINLFYKRTIYAKKGGCMIVKSLIEQMPLAWTLQYILKIFKAHIYVIRELSDDVCSGTIEVASQNIEFILRNIFTSLANCDKNSEIYIKFHKSIVNEFVLQTANPCKLVREAAKKALHQIAALSNMTLTAMLEPYKSFFSDIIVFTPAKTYLRHQPLSIQIGILEANYFCTSLEPKLMKFDNYQFLTDVKIIIKCDDDTMTRYDAYKDVRLLPELRETAMRVLVSWHYIYHKQHYDTEKLKNINFCGEAFVTLFKALENYESLQQTAFECLKILINECKEKSETGWPVQESFLETLSDYMNWTTASIKRLSYYCLLFPKNFTEKICDQLFEILKKLLQTSIATNKDQNYLKIAKSNDHELKIAAIIDLFHLIPACTPKFVILLIRLILAVEDEDGIGLETSCPYRKPLIKFLLRYPEETVTFLLSDDNVKNPQYNRFTIYLLKHKDGSSFKTVMENRGSRLKELILKDKNDTRTIPQLFMTNVKVENESQHQAVQIIYTIIEQNDQWLASQMSIVTALNQVWKNDLLSNMEQNVTNNFWHLTTKILLHYFEHNPGDIELLFQLLKVFNKRCIPDFQFLRDFIYTICQNYTVDWKRNAFFLFVDYYNRPTETVELKIKILTMIIIPCFAVSFEKGEENRLIRGHGQEEDHNLITIFLNKIVNPFMIKENDDELRIVLLQFACLLVERASPYIQSNKKEDIRQLTTFGYSSLLHSKNYWDPTAIYNGHLLLSHIIARLANKKSWQEVVFKVFHSLLKAHAIEARHIVRQTLEVFMPIMPLKMNESNLSLVNLTKSVIVKDGYAILQLYHVFQVIIRHHTVYYPVRHQIIQNMITSMQRLESSNSLDYRKLAIDIAEVIINWELRRIKETSEEGDLIKQEGSSKKISIGEISPLVGTSSQYQVDESSNKPIEWIHCKAIINFLFDLLFMLSEQTTQITQQVSPNEVISKHSLNLLKRVLKKDVWIKSENDDLQFTRLRKVFEEPSKVSSSTVCNFLEIFIHLLDEMDSNKILSIIKTLQPGLAICITSAQTKVLRLMSTFLSKLITLFPVEVYISHDELRFLYDTVEKAIRNGLEIFEKDAETPTGSFFGTFLILKTAFSNDSQYFVKFVEKFTKFVVLLKNEHLVSNQQAHTVSSPNIELTKEMLMQSLLVLKNYVNVMNVETRSNFINVILIELIEKSNDPRIIKTIIQILDSWFKLKNCQSQPCFREKIVLLQKLTYHIEIRFSTDASLNAQFLELIYFIFCEGDLNNYEITSKLEQAFLIGLKCSQIEVRQKFLKFFDESVGKDLYSRMLYILSTRAWNFIGHHYWIKQCIELVFLSVDEKDTLNIKEEFDTKDFPGHPKTAENENLDDDLTDFSSITKEFDTTDYDTFISTIINNQVACFHDSRNLTKSKFVHSVAQIAHTDTNLAESLWMKIFPQIWSTFNESQRNVLTKEIIQFLSSGAKVNVKDANAMNTFTQALTICDPPVVIPPKLMQALSKVHNLWHRMILVAEEMIEEHQQYISRDEDTFDSSDENDEMLQDTVGSLSKMYSSLREEDLWSGLWQKYAKYSETKSAIIYEQMGHFEEAQSSYESVMLKFKQDLANGLNSAELTNEIDLWEDHWIRCSKELNDWGILQNYGLTNKEKYSLLLTNCSWKLSDWNLMKQSLIRAELTNSNKTNYEVSLYGGYVSLLCQKDNNVGKFIEQASTVSLEKWKQLPNIVSNIHIPILQFAQQIMELQEASQIHQDLLRKQGLPFHDMKSIIKTWRNRLPIISDDISHWKDIFTWRQYHYKLISENASGNNLIVANLGLQASAQTYIKLGKVARKHNLTSICQKSLQEMEVIPSVPLTDCFQKILQNLKCLIQISQYSEDPVSNLNTGLKTIDNLNLELFQAESKAILCAYKGHFYTLLGNAQEASKAFTVATELCDSNAKVWGLYGEYMEAIFTSNSKTLTSAGVSAITCYLHASREYNEFKTRKYLAKIIYLLTFDEGRAEMLKAFENYMLGVPTINWLTWIPQLFNILIQYEGDTVMNLLNQIAKTFPQAIYFPIRTLYLVLKIEQRERYKNIELLKNQQSDQPGTSAINPPNLLSMKSTSAMWRCSKIMQLVREIHPTIVCSLENILDQIMSKSDVDGVRWFRENIFEENLHQLKQALAKCYSVAYDNRTVISSATITPQTLNFIRKLISNFNSEYSTEASAQDSVFIKLSEQFSKGFNFTQPEGNKLLDLISRLKTCIEIMEEKIKELPKSFIIEEKYRFLSNFNQKVAEIDLPGELLLPRNSHYHVKISRFLPKVDIIQKHNTSARRLFIQGTNGKIYPYLVVNDSGLADARREERVLQYLRMLNCYLSKYKETSKRFLHLTVPRVVAVFPQMRLVEDNPNSISFADILKQHCANSNVDFNAPVARYYERLEEIQQRGAQTTHLTLRDIFREIQRKMIPKTIFKDWALKTYPSATDYWTFRRTFTNQLALCSIMEYGFYMTRLNAEMMYLHQDSGLMNVAYFKFDLDDSTGEMSAIRPVPFRLTPNVAEFVTNIGISGPFSNTIVATARCMLQPNYQIPAILRTILRDEIISINRKHILNNKPIDPNEDLSIDKSYSEINSDQVIQTLECNLAHVRKRLEELMFFDPSSESYKITGLTQKATSYDFLSHMDPVWLPFF